MSISANPSQLLKADVPDVYELRRMATWDTEFRQLDKGAGLTRVTGRAGAMVSAGGLHIHSKVHQVGCAPGGMLAFGLPARGKLLTWMDFDVPLQPLVCFGAGQQFEGVSAANFAGVTLRVNDGAFHALALEFGLELPAAVADNAIFDLDQNPQIAARLLQKARAYLDQDLWTSAPEAEDELALALLLSLTGVRACEPRETASTRAKVRERALEIIEADLESLMKISALCVACETSWPTLHRAFVERFGIGPKTYVNALRLNRVRAALVDAPPGTGVGEIANRWGFWHMGQFAKDYRDLFGRLPSLDLSRAHNSPERTMRFLDFMIGAHLNTL